MSQHANFNLGSLFPFQAVESLFVCNHIPYISFSIYTDNLVSRKDSDLFRRSSFDDSCNPYRIISNDKLYAYTAERPFQVIVGSLCILC